MRISSSLSAAAVLLAVGASAAKVDYAFDEATALAQRVASATPAQRHHFEVSTSINLKKLLRHFGLPTKARLGVGHGEQKRDEDAEEEGDLERRQSWSWPWQLATNTTGPRKCTPANVAPLRGLKNPANCTVKIQSSEIDDPVDGLITASINNWAGGRIPPQLRGLFYMEGNPNPTEVFTTATAVWNASAGTFDIPTYQPRTWSQDTGSMMITQNLRQGTTFQTKCTKDSSTGLLKCGNTLWRRDTGEVLYAGDYTCDETTRTNVWVRASNAYGITLPGQPKQRYTYGMIRIVDEFGKRTPEFKTRYLANIGRFQGVEGQSWVHLSQTQEVPNRR